MHRRIPALLAVTAAALLGACRTYDAYSPIADQAGLVPPDQFATYGREQAQAVAIGREFAMATHGTTAEARAAGIEAATSFARRLPDVQSVRADTLGYRLVVTFRSGWERPVVPIGDGKNGAETPNLPNLSAPR